MAFEVHYIGKAFDQTIWDRLKRHSNYTDVLTEEAARGRGDTRPALEVTLFTLKITGLDEDVVVPGCDYRSDELPPKMYRFRPDAGDDRFEAFTKRWVLAGDAAATVELETWLINSLKPKYNAIHYNEYPEVAGGLREAGYSDVAFTIDRFPFILRTKDGEEPLARWR